MIWLELLFLIFALGMIGYLNYRSTLRTAHRLEKDLKGVAPSPLIPSEVFLRLSPK